MAQRLSRVGTGSVSVSPSSKLEHQLEAAGERMLQSRHRCFAQRVALQADECRILVVLHNRDDALLNWSFWISGILLVDFATNPATGCHIDAETEDALVPAPP
jgi:hypothetical protein